jgi:hypothetical protein
MKENVEIVSEKAKMNVSTISALPMLKPPRNIRMQNGRNPEMNSPAFGGDTYNTEVMSS